MLLFVQIAGIISFAIFCWSIPMMKNAKIAEWKSGLKFFKIAFIAGIAFSAIFGIAYLWLTR